MTGSPATVLMTVDAVGGVWSFALSLCRALPEIRFVLAIMGPQPAPAQRAAVAPLGNVGLVESDFRLGGQAEIALMHLLLATGALPALLECLKRLRATLIFAKRYPAAALLRTAVRSQQFNTSAAFRANAAVP